jgi:hypothetical protein
MATNDMTVGSRRFKCPHCGAFSGHEWKPLHEVFPGGWGDGPTSTRISDGDPMVIASIDFADREIWQASQCASCWNHSLWIGTKMVFPAQWVIGGIAAPHVDMPEDIADLYREAAAVLPHSRRAAAALSRAALEKLAKVLTPELSEKVQLNGRLEVLSDVVPGATAKGLHMIRYIGNKALHGADEREDSEAITLYLDDREGTGLAELLFLAINDLVEQLISKPKKYEDAFEIFPDAFKEGIDRSAAKRRAMQSDPVA